MKKYGDRKAKTEEGGSASECERLRNEVQRLEEQHLHDRHQIEKLEMETRAFRRALRDWAKQQVTLEECERWASELKEEECQELHEFYDDLEKIVRGRANA
jgi:hypothetical protein